MAVGQTIQTLFEVAMLAFVIYGIFHEDKFIAFEERIAKAWKAHKETR